MSTAMKTFMGRRLYPPPMRDAAPVLAAIAEAARTSRDRDHLARPAVIGIKGALKEADWVGVYWLDGDVLVLGPYLGAATEHTRIPVGVGVCGTAVAEDRDQVVRDVRERPNYLACSTKTRSEIVVLVRAGDRVLGQLDLDSDRVGAFADAEHAFLAKVAGALGSALTPRAPVS